MKSRRRKLNTNRGDIIDLWEFLKHGDQDHQMWLLEALEAWFDDLPRPLER